MPKGKHRRTSRTARSTATVGALGLGVLALTPGIAHAAPQEAWDAVAQCESGNQNIESVSPQSSASGYFQIVDGTWAAYGGLEYAPRAIEATYLQQLAVAERILAGQGPTAWVNGCGDPLLGFSSQNRDPAPPAPPAPQPAPQIDPANDPRTGADYVVEPGDTLVELGALFDVPWREIAEANGILDPWTIHVGQVLRIPRLTQQDIIDLTGQGRDPGAQPPVQEPPVQEPITEELYVVVEGDTMSQIAVDNEVCLDDLLGWNTDVVEDPDLIFPGEELVVRMGALPPVPASAPVEEAAAYEVLPTGNTYTVQPGDTLGRLFGTGWELVALYNDIHSPFVIYPGQVLEIGEAIPNTGNTRPVASSPISGALVVRPVPGAAGDDLDSGRGHEGLDLNCETGDPVVAALAGTVNATRTFDGGQPYTGYGLVVDIIGTDGALYRYAHLSQVNVSVGQDVTAGQRIALCGNTGGSTGSHLHFERRPSGELYGTPDSPTRWLRENGITV